MEQLSHPDIWINGSFVPWEKACVHPFCHGLQRGSVLFESIDCNEASNGRAAIFRLREHMLRFENSARIINMPLGYEQVVGERGVGLSGGQLQRLCIARALYHDPRLLIFDEATSALDTQSEGNILRNMKDILTGRTAVVIAHRLSTIMSADKILVLYNGSVVEEGKHEELVDKKGMYFQLVKKQIA